MAENFNRLRNELDERLDALPDGQGDEIRERGAAQLERDRTEQEKPDDGRRQDPGPSCEP